MEDHTSRVYVRTDAQGCITRCEGGYTTPDDLAGWTEIDQGAGDRFNLCQAHYFPGGLHTHDGLLRWKLADGVATLRTAAELEADRVALPKPEPTAQDDMVAIMTDHELRLTLLELGV